MQNYSAKLYTIEQEVQTKLELMVGIILVQMRGTGLSHLSPLVKIKLKPVLV